MKYILIACLAFVLVGCGSDASDRMTVSSGLKNSLEELEIGEGQSHTLGEYEYLIIRVDAELRKSIDDGTAGISRAKKTK